MRAKNLLILNILLLLPVICLGPAMASTTPSDTVVFSHVSVITMRTDQVLADQTVIVSGGKILKMGPTKDVAVPKDSVTVDGSGKYLMPGLADLHVHLFSSDDLLSYAANGVTTVLNMDGSPMHLRWREQVRRGEILGPAIYTASHTMDGLPPLNEMFFTAEKPETAAAYVRESKRAGYDFIKLYGTLRPDVFRAILQAAAQEKIPVAGHINRQVGALEVLKSNQVLAAHLEDLIFSRFDRPPTDPELVEFADAIAASRITVTPNLNVNPTNAAQLKDLDAVLRSAEADLLPPAAYSQWMPANSRNERNDQTAQQLEQMQQVQTILYKLVRLLNARGVRLVLGTDAAPYGFPGLSAHQELAELVEAGFTPYQALVTATRNPGEFLAENVPSAEHFGTIEEGFAADLLLLAANPLANVQNAKRIDGVMLRGRWLPAAEIGKLQASVRAHNAEIKQRLLEIDAALEMGDMGRAEKAAEPLAVEKPPWIAEWVLMTKARKLQGTKLPAAIQVARWSVRMYPESFSAYTLLADLLMQAGKLSDALPPVRESLRLEPNNAASLNLLEKIQALQEPPRFTPVGTYRIEYTNDQSGETQSSDLLIEAAPDGRLTGKKSDLREKGDQGGEASALRSVQAGRDRLWAVAETPYGPLEFRITVQNTDLTGYWAGPFGRNGKLAGKKIK